MMLQQSPESFGRIQKATEGLSKLQTSSNGCKTLHHQASKAATTFGRRQKTPEASTVFKGFPRTFQKGSWGSSSLQMTPEGFRRLQKAQGGHYKSSGGLCWSMSNDKPKKCAEKASWNLLSIISKPKPKNSTLGQKITERSVQKAILKYFHLQTQKYIRPEGRQNLFWSISKPARKK